MFLRSFTGIIIAATSLAALAGGALAGNSTAELTRSNFAWDGDKDVSIRELVRPAGWVSPPHHHTGQVFLLVVEGEGAMELGERLLQGGPGTVMEAQPGEVMVMKNASESEPFTFMLFQIGPVDEPSVIMKK